MFTNYLWYIASIRGILYNSSNLRTLLITISWKWTCQVTNSPRTLGYVLQALKSFNQIEFEIILIFLSFWARKVTRKSDSYAHICLHSNSKLNPWLPEGEVLHCAIMLRTCTHFLWTIFSYHFLLYFKMFNSAPLQRNETKMI